MVHVDDYGEQDRGNGASDLLDAAEGMRIRRMEDGRWNAVLIEDERAWWIGPTLREVLDHVVGIAAYWKGVP